MNVPLADEVRACRVLLEAAEVATKVMARVRWDRAVIGGHEQRLALGGNVTEVPGDDTLALSHSARPVAMADVLQQTLGEGEPIARRLQVRLQQLQAVEELFSPAVQTYEALGQRMTGLQMAQGDAMQIQANWDLLREVMMRRLSLAQAVSRSVPLAPEEGDLRMMRLALGDQLPVLLADRPTTTQPIDAYVLRCRAVHVFTSINVQARSVGMWPDPPPTVPVGPLDLESDLRATDQVIAQLSALLAQVEARHALVAGMIADAAADQHEATAWLRATLG